MDILCYRGRSGDQFVHSFLISTDADVRKYELDLCKFVPLCMLWTTRVVMWKSEALSAIVE